MLSMIRSGPREARDWETKLPAPAARKLHRLLDEQEDVSAAAGIAGADQTLAWEELRRRQQRVGQIAGEKSRQLISNAGLNQAVSDAERDRETAARELARIRERVQRLEARRSGLPAAIVEWVKRLSAQGQLVMAHPGTVKLARGQTHHEAIEVARGRIGDLRRDIEALRTAPLPSSDVKLKMRHQIGAMAAAGAPDVQPAIDRNGRIAFPLTGCEVMSDSYTRVNAPDATGLVAWMFKDQLIARLDAEIDAAAHDDIAVSDADRARRRTEMNAEILRIEREECALIEDSASIGVFIAYREDTSPEAALGVTTDDKPDNPGIVGKLLGRKRAQDGRPTQQPAEEPFAEIARSGEALNGRMPADDHL